MIDYANMRKSLLASFGEPVTVTVAGLARPFTAAFLSPHVGLDVSGVLINRPDPQFIATAADWDATAAVAGDVIARAGVNYTAIDVQPTDDGMVVVLARRYP